LLILFAITTGFEPAFYWKKVQVAQVHEYITGHDLLAGETFMTTGGKYSFGVHNVTVGKVVTAPANLQLPSKLLASKHYRLPRGYIEIMQMTTAIRGWSYSESLFPPSGVPPEQ